jgi:hypothetical protein
MSSNQQEINSVDQFIWREERGKIYDRLKQISIDLSLEFRHDFDSIEFVKKDKIIVSYLFDLMPDTDCCKEIDNICKKSGKRIWFVTDNIIDSKTHNFKNLVICSYPELLGMTSLGLTDFKTRSPPSKLFNCFMQRTDSVRQSWFYFLWLENLLDRGYVSYLLYQLSDYSKLTGKDLFEFIHFNKGLNSLQKFQHAYDALKPQVPYRNFPENLDLSFYIKDSKYSLILETYAVNDDRGQWCLTEKLLRSLQFDTINLLFAQKGTIQIIKNLGLAIDDINDEFDNLDWIYRQRKILEVLIADNVATDNNIKYNQCLHNRSLLNDWKKTYKKTNFFDDLKENIYSS